MCVCAYMCPWRPETKTRIQKVSSSTVPTLLFKTGSLTELASRLVSKQAPPSAEGTDLDHCALLWMQVLGLGTQVLLNVL